MYGMHFNASNTTPEEHQLILAKEAKGVQSTE